MTDGKPSASCESITSSGQLQGLPWNMFELVDDEHQWTSPWYVLLQSGRWRCTSAVQAPAGSCKQLAGQAQCAAAASAGPAAGWGGPQDHQVRLAGNQRAVFAPPQQTIRCQKVTSQYWCDTTQWLWVMGVWVMGLVGYGVDLEQESWQVRWVPAGGLCCR